MSALNPLILAALAAMDERSELRRLRASAMLPGGRLERDGRVSLDFSSNDYLGLTQHPLLIERAREWTARAGTGSGASRLVTGTHDLHLAVEARIARFKGAEAALLFASGWQANAAVLPALLRLAGNVQVFCDRLIHGSLHHGCAAAGVRQVRFRHNDLDHLERLLADKAGGGGPCLIVTESVFSMDGDRPDLARLVAIARAHDAFLYLDEAHATGVLGPGGAGLSATVPGGFDLVMGTFSKAFGGFGAYVAGSRSLCEYIANASSGFVMTTALPPSVLGAIDAALDLVPAMDAERAHLAAMGDRVRSALISSGFDVGGSTTQIIPAIVGGAQDALALSAHLADHGVTAVAIRPPTVPAGSSRVRLALRSTHSDADIDHLLTVVVSAPQAPCRA
jgi:8-amino-7-oxononanoate synthase